MELTKGEFLKLPMKERRAILRKQADKISPYYKGIDDGHRWYWKNMGSPCETPRNPYRGKLRMKLWADGFEVGIDDAANVHDTDY